MSKLNLQNAFLLLFISAEKNTAQPHSDAVLTQCYLITQGAYEWENKIQSLIKS